MNLPPSLVQLLTAPPEVAPPPPKYPCSDGQPMADNSRQTYWIVLLYCNLCWLFRSRQDVAVHANLFWYVEEDDPGQRQAPDVLRAERGFEPFFSRNPSFATQQGHVQARADSTTRVPENPPCASRSRDRDGA